MAQVLPVASLALFILLALTFAYVLRRAARVVAVTREDEAFRRDGAALAERAVVAITAGAAGIDRVRRRTDPPSTLEEVLPPFLETLAAVRVEAEALAPPSPLIALGARMADEIDRAVRAVEMVQHGCALLGDGGGRPGQLEGETSVKRGYLNLLHSRESLASLAAGLRSGRATAGGWYSGRPRIR